MTPYLETLAVLYRSVQEVTGCELIVDSSKTALYGYLLGSLPGIDLHVVHLVRDLREVEESLARRRAAGHPGFASHNILGGFIEWARGNLLISWLLPAVATTVSRVRYEDFVAAPRATVERVLSVAGFPDKNVPIQGDRANVALTHGFGGNERRFARGSVQIVANSYTNRKLGPSLRFLLGLMASPVRLLLGVDRGRDVSTSIRLET
jgi:hypothetical protein